MDAYAREGNAFGEFLIVGPASSAGASGSWPNLAFDWSEAIASNPYITDGIVQGDARHPNGSFPHNAS